MFEDQQKANVIPTYQQLFDFTLHQVQACELANESSSNQYKVKPQSLMAQSVANTSKPTQGYSSLCICCNQQHPLFTCNKFSALPVNAKYQLLRSCNRCFNRLGAHSRSHCTSKASCRLCNSTQHLLDSQSNENSHSNVKNAPVATPALSSKSPVPDSGATSATVLSCTTKKNTVRTPNVSLLGTSVAHISDSFGRQVAIRGVIDPGSQVSFITKSIVNNLHLPFRKNSAAIHGISETTSRTAGTSHCTLSSTIDNSKVHVNFLVLDQISHQLPTVSFHPELLRSIQPLRMADPSFSQPGKIDFLLGADVYPKILSDERPLCLSEGPVATMTIFGWTLIGPITKLPMSHHTVSLMASYDLSEQLTKFWEVEQVAVVPPTDPLELAAKQHFAKTHHRNSDGRYVVALPFMPNAKTLANNTYSAKRSLIALEKRLAKHPNLEREYHDFLNEYVDSQHMSPAPSASSYIIPHHVVTKDTNQGPKIRVVFNASSHDAAGSSLNIQLLKGPKLQQDISDVLLTFRLHQIALCCDIKQMYRQIMVTPDDRRHQHIFWRPDPHGNIQEAELNTVTYGLTPSAFLAVRVLHQLVNDEGAPFPAAARAILHHTYVDDVISGASDVTSATLLQKQLTSLLARGGFELRKWCSSHPAVLTDIPDEPKESPLIISDQEKSLKILGLNWDPVTDMFNFRVQPFDGVCTKRTMLSFIARIFDPNGYLAPFVFSLKLFIQKLWISKIDWDDQVPPDIFEKWSDSVSSLSLLQAFAIPRCVLPTFIPDELYLVGFCDASQLGYAAVVYLYFASKQNRRSMLWKAKSRIAPLKTISIPRLELCSVVLLSDLIRSISQVQYPLNVSHVKCFSDFEIVLHWLQTPPHKLKTFVANQVTHITEPSLITQHWHHIDTTQNPPHKTPLT